MEEAWLTGFCGWRGVVSRFPPDLQAWLEFHGTKINYQRETANFSSGAFLQVGAGFPRSNRLMSDPTEMVLTGGFAAAFGIFMIAAVVRRVMGANPPGGAWVDAVPVEGALPEVPPMAVRLPPQLPVGKVPVWFYRPLDLVGSIFVFGVFSTLVLGSLRASRETLPVVDVGTLLVTMGFQFVMAGTVAALVVWRVGWVTWLGLRWPGWQRVFLIAPGSVIFMWVIFGGLQVSGYVEWMESLGVETVQDTVKLLQQSQDPLILALMAMAAVVAAPLCEEMVFRGYFYPVLKKFAGPWSAAICSALVFAAAHGSLTALLPLFVFGGVLVFIYEKTGSLWAPVAVHCCFNSATVIVQFAARYYHFPLDSVP